MYVVATVTANEAMTWKENKGNNMGGFGGRIGREKQCDYINNLTKQKQQCKETTCPCTAIGSRYSGPVPLSGP